MAALHEQRAVADVLDARGEDEQWMVLRWPAPANGDRQRRALIEVGQEEMGQAAGGASGASARAQEHRNDAKPNPHASVSTRLQEVEHAIITKRRSKTGPRVAGSSPAATVARPSRNPLAQAGFRRFRAPLGFSARNRSRSPESGPHWRATGAGCYSRRT